MLKTSLLLMLSAAVSIAGPFTTTSAAEFNGLAPGALVEPFSSFSILTSTGAIVAGEWSDRLVPGGTTTTFSIAGTQMIAFGGIFDNDPGGEGTGLGFCLVRGAECEAAGYFGGNLSLFPDGFIGVVSTLPFDGIRIFTNATGANAETFTIAEARVLTATPEPGSYLMLAAGLVMVAIGRKLSK